MKITLDIYIKIVLTIILMVIGSKVIAPIISNWWIERAGRKRKKKHNLDIIIGEKQDILKKEQQMLSHTLSNKKEERKQDVAQNLISQYKNKIEVNCDDLSKNEIESFKTMIEILENLHWGDGKNFNEIQSEWKQKYQMNIPLTEINTTMQRIIKSEISSYFINELPNTEQTCQLLTSYVYIKDLCSTDHKGNVFTMLSKKLEIDTKYIMQGAHFYLLQNEGNAKTNHVIYDYILRGNSPISRRDPNSIYKLILKNLFIKNTKHIIKTETLENLIYQEAIVFNCLKKLPELSGQKDLETAMSIFNITADEPNMDKKIKKIYKNLAKSAHPDRLAGKGLPEKYMNLAHENFVKIQAAYDIIKEKSKG